MSILRATENENQIEEAWVRLKQGIVDVLNDEENVRKNFADLYRFSYKMVVV